MFHHGHRTSFTRLASCVFLGLTCGFLATQIFQYYVGFGVVDDKVADAHRKLLLARSQPFIPKHPHSHGETDRYVGPDEKQQWSDDTDPQHDHGDDHIARQLYKEVRVLCWVMTSPKNLKSKAQHVKATWGKRCNKLIFMSSKKDDTLPAVGLDVSEGRNFLWDKTREAFKYIYDHHLDDADWFLKADDDTFVVLENLRLTLKKYNSSQPVYLGCRFKPYVTQGYMSGGAGYVLSKASVKRFVTRGMPHHDRCSSSSRPEDLGVGSCLEAIGVTVVDSRDNEGRERFHPFVPEHMIVPGILSKSEWVFQYYYYGFHNDKNCCSPSSVSFHYMPPNMMYVYEYLLYHLRPHGATTMLVLPEIT